MPLVDTKYFGALPYSGESVFDFPLGLPAFEAECSFVPIELPEHAPLVFLQSLTNPELCFLALPVQVVDREYRLRIAGEDLAALGLDPHHQPALGADVLVLTLISLRDSFSGTANLMAPIVVNLKNRRAVQAIRDDRAYSHQHPLSQKAREEAC